MQVPEETQEIQQSEPVQPLALDGQQMKKLMERIKIMLVMKQLKEDNLPIEIIPNLYIGCLGSAFNKKKLIEMNIKYVLSVCEMPKVPFTDFTYLVINVNDSADQEIKSKFDESNEFIKHALQSGQGVLVHCFAGKSRSSSMIIAYLIKNHNMNLQDALALVKSKRSLVQPNSGFMKQLDIYYKEHQMLMGMNQ